MTRYKRESFVLSPWLSEREHRTEEHDLSAETIAAVLAEATDCQPTDAFTIHAEYDTSADRAAGLPTRIVLTYPWSHNHTHTVHVTYTRL